MTILTKEEVIDKAVKSCKQHICSKRVGELIVSLPKPELDGHDVIYNDERVSRISLSFSPPTWLYAVTDDSVVIEDEVEHVLERGGSWEPVVKAIKDKLALHAKYDPNCILALRSIY